MVGGGNYSIENVHRAFRVVEEVAGDDAVVHNSDDTWMECGDFHEGVEDDGGGPLEEEVVVEEPHRDLS
jgi:hypothetical protein